MEIAAHIPPVYTPEELGSKGWSEFPDPGVRDWNRTGSALVSQPFQPSSLILQKSMVY